MSMTGIKKAEAKDAKELDRLISAEFPYKQLSREKIEERMKRPEIVVFKKIAGKEMAGFVEIEIMEQAAMINAISVKSKFRKRGFGKELLEHSVGTLMESGVETARLLVKAENGMAKKLYKKCGFEFMGLHARKIEGSDVEVWEKRLAGDESGYLN